MKTHHINKMIVLGGGTAGLIAAMFIKRTNPEIDVTILESSELGIIGVGEGSTEHWGLNLMKILDIPAGVLLEETDATIKLGIKFDNWNGDGKHYFHSLINPLDSKFHNKVLSYLTYCVTEDFPSVTPHVTKHMFHPSGYNGTHQYHFDTFKLNTFLHKLAAETYDIKFKDCIVDDVILDDNGYVKSLKDSSGEIHSADFFVDCSGFKKVIMSKLGAKWLDYGKYLPMNHAIAFPTEHNKDYPAWTLSKALTAGWNWRIPTQERYGNGYVFCDSYISTDQAIAEIEKEYGHKINVARDIKFSAGRLDKIMMKNCVAMGLAAVFVEPLEASSIGATIQQATVLANSISKFVYGKDNIEKTYNAHMDNMLENIVSFIQLHYFNKRDDTKFWKDKPFEMTPFNAETLEIYKHTMPSYEDFNKAWLMFTDANWAQVMQGLELYDKDSIKKLWNRQPKHARDDISQIYAIECARDAEILTVPHHQHILHVIQQYKEFQEMRKQGIPITTN